MIDFIVNLILSGLGIAGFFIILAGIWASLKNY